MTEMTGKTVRVGDYKVKTLTQADLSELMVLLRDKKNNNLDDQYAYDYLNKLETKVHRIALALQTL